MPSNEQRRQAAKRKLERQLARRAERARRRKTVAVATTIAVVVAAVVGIFYLTRTGSKDTANAASPPKPSASSQNAAPAKATSGPCHYTPTQQPAAKPVELPEDPSPTPSRGTVQATLATNQGEIGLTLNRAKAPCTVQSFVHLAEANFYDDSPCHRLTTSQALQVLQCGDPTGKGTGGPGYSFDDELPKNLAPAPEQFQGPKGNTKIYPRGTLAMANSGPDTNGSQFFLVYEDSYLPPNYTVFGRISEQGLKVLDKVAAAGVEPGTKSKPKMPVTIKDVAVEA